MARRSQDSRDVRRRWELRVLVALPAVWVLFAAIEGYVAIQMTIAATGYASDPAVAQRLDQVRLLVIGLGGVAALGLGMLLSIAVTRPARELLQKIQHRLRGNAALSLAGSNELQQLSNVFDSMLLSFDEFVSDTHIVNGMPLAILVVDNQDTIVRANEEARNLFHAGARRLEGTRLEDRCAPGMSHRLREALKAVRDSATPAEVPSDIILGANGGGAREIIVVFHPTTNVGEVVVTIRDMSRVQTIRGQIQRVDQLAALGAHVASLAHEIGGGLMGIQLLLESLDPRTSDDTRVHRRLQEEVDRALRLLAEIRTFGQSRSRDRVSANLGRLVEETVWLLESRFVEKEITVVKKLDFDLPPLLVDRDRVVQAVLNIVTNAFDATPSGGTVTVTTERAEDAALVRIANTGSFIRSEERAKVFTLFYTTKKKGSGLGLPLARRTLLDHGGDIEVTSSPESGTEFILRFPDAARTPGAAELPVSAAAPQIANGLETEERRSG